MKHQKTRKPPNTTPDITLKAAIAHWKHNDDLTRIEWSCPYCQQHEELQLIALNPTRGLSLRMCYKTLKHYMVMITMPPPPTHRN